MAMINRYCIIRNLCCVISVCPSGWTRIGLGCYQRPDLAMRGTWEEGKARCKAMGRYLLNIDDEEENNAIYKHYKGLHNWVQADDGFLLGGKGSVILTERESHMRSWYISVAVTNDSKF